jgi:hypothetical protein
MKGVPLTALVLALAGLLPFLWGAAMALSLAPQRLPGMGQVPGALSDENVLVSYGTIILCFMSGVLWGFAARARGGIAALGYVASVVPALWPFFMLGGGREADLLVLAFGFVGLLAFDWGFWRAGLAPAWWMTLRLPVSAVAVLCLGVGLMG